MKNYYKILGIRTSASPDEIRRAYRILARRYHPDLNPDKETQQRFKDLVEAHNTLKDQKSRDVYDSKLEAFLKDQYYNSEHSKEENTTRDFDEQSDEVVSDPAILDWRDAVQLAKNKLQKFQTGLKSLLYRGRVQAASARISQISVIEVSLTIEESIRGVRKSVEIAEPDGKTRKISVALPAGVRDGSVSRMRNKNNPTEDLILIVHHAFHPFLSIRPRGLIAEIPVSIKEAVYGAEILVPSINGQVKLKIPANTQSGSEIRIHEGGIQFPNGRRGDYFVRLMVHVPPSGEAHGLKDKIDEIDRYYEQNVRRNLPTKI